MSQLQIRNDLLGQAITTLAPLVGGISYENADFDPVGLDKWSAVYFVPVTSESAGKSFASSDQERGFLQINVYIKANALDYDSAQLTIIDEIKKDFYYGAKVANVDILEVTTANGFTTEAWYQRVITINYSSFASRG